MNPRSALLLCINSIRIGNSLLFSEVPARWLSLLRMERMIYFYLPFPFEFTRSSIKVGTNNYPITSSVRDKWSRIIVGSSLKSCRARWTKAASPPNPILLNTQKLNEKSILFSSIPSTTKLIILLSYTPQTANSSKRQYSSAWLKPYCWSRLKALSEISTRTSSLMAYLK